MPVAGIEKLIINSPFEAPKQHWLYDRETRSFSLAPGRRPAGYVKASTESRTFDDPGIFVPIPLVNQIRESVDVWRAAGYPGVTGTTRRLLDHWNDVEFRPEGRRFFFCQMEAMETVIWLTESATSDRMGVEIPREAGQRFPRLCSKLATGTGKTVVMAMLIAWQALNKVAYPQDERFSKHVFILAPGLTVKSRLRVLIPSELDNYYDEFEVVPPGLREALNQAKVLVRNWHVLNWESEEKIKKKKSVDKRGAKSDEAYAREVLGDLASVSNLLVINDEAHHAWRLNPEFKKKRTDDPLLWGDTTKWVDGLDRIHRARRILQCYDFSATPFAPSGKASTEEALFDWIVSDFGLNDAIEAGLVKTPRIVIRDNMIPDAKTYQSKLYHIYLHVRDELQKAEPTERLPDLATMAYTILGYDWLATQQAWKEKGYPTPPVMITVANRVETAARIKHAFDKKKMLVEELCDPPRTLHIDSKVLESAEEKDEGDYELSASVDDDVDDEPTEKKLTKDQLAEQLRRTVDTVGRVGELGEQIQNVISVGMLSEGWDAKTVTHIMGLRAFTSQLLCEQVVGRGLRRTSYEVGDDGLYEAEYVNVFGVPFTFLPHESEADGIPDPPKPKTRIEALPAKAAYEISWPNVIRIDHTFRPTLSLDLKTVPALTLNSTDIIDYAKLAGVVAGKPHMDAFTEIELMDFAERFRYQKIVFEIAADVFEQMKPTWKGSRENLLGQVIALVEKFLTSPKLKITPPSFAQDDLRKRVMLTLHMNKIVRHVFQQIRFGNTEAIEPVFDGMKPIRSTRDMLPWYTGKPVSPADKSHINFCVADSSWEASPWLDRDDRVLAWAKNDHLGFEINYMFDGALAKYRPDFLIRLSDGSMLVIEVKGMNTEKDRAKRRFLQEWIEAVNSHGGFGTWKSALVLKPSDFPTAIEKSL